MLNILLTAQLETTKVNRVVYLLINGDNDGVVRCGDLDRRTITLLSQLS